MNSSLSFFLPFRAVCFFFIIRARTGLGPAPTPALLLTKTIEWIEPEALNSNLSTLSIDAQKRAQKDAAKKKAKAALNEQRETERKAAAKVLIKRVERNKRKFVTVISGLEGHGIDLKKIAKELGKKFATGSSVTKTASGGEEITVQGDVSDDVYDWLTEKYEEIPEDNIDCIEDKKKKAVG